jgi:hypothetical protein
VSVYKREYKHGTYLVTRAPWGTFVGGRVHCPDGRVRTLSRIAITADSFFSIPAKVNVRGKSVSGFVTFANDKNGDGFLEFVPTGKNTDSVFPEVQFIKLSDLEWHAKYWRPMSESQYATFNRRACESKPVRF